MPFLRRANEKEVQTNGSDFSTLGKRHLREWGPLLLLLLLAGVLRCYGLSNTPIWSDEAARLSLAEVSTETWLEGLRQRQVFCSPLVIFLLRGWMVVNNTGEVWPRLPFVIMGVLSLIPFYYLIRNLMGRRAAIISGMLLAVNPYHILYTQLVSEYGVLIGMSILSMLVWRRQISKVGSGRWGSYLVPGMNVLSLLIHQTAVCVSCIQCTLDALSGRWKRRMFWLNLIPIFVCGFLAAKYSQNQYFRASLRWASPLSWDGFVDLLRQYSHGGIIWHNLILSRPPSFTALLWITTILIVIGVIGLVIGRGERDRLTLQILLIWFATPIILLGGASLVLMNLWVPRYLVIVLPPFLALAGIGLHFIVGSSRLRTGVALLLLLGLYGHALYLHYRPVKPSCRELARDIRMHIRPNDGVIFLQAITVTSIGYYLDRSPDRSLFTSLDRPPIFPGRFSPPPTSWWFSPDRLPDIPDRRREVISLRWMSNKDRIWLVSLSTFSDTEVDVPLFHTLCRGYEIAHGSRYPFDDSHLILFKKRSTAAGGESCFVHARALARLERILLPGVFPRSGELGWSEDTSAGKPGVEEGRTKAEIEAIIGGTHDPYYAEECSGFAKQDYWAPGDGGVTYKLSAYLWEMFHPGAAEKLGLAKKKEEEDGSGVIFENVSNVTPVHLGDDNPNWKLYAWKGSYVLKIIANHLDQRHAEAIKRDVVSFATFIMDKIPQTQLEDGS